MNSTAELADAQLEPLKEVSDKHTQSLVEVTQAIAKSKQFNNIENRGRVCGTCGKRSNRRTERNRVSDQGHLRQHGRAHVGEPWAPHEAQEGHGEARDVAEVRRLADELHDGVPTNITAVSAEIEAEWAHDFALLKPIAGGRG